MVLNEALKDLIPKKIYFFELLCFESVSSGKGEIARRAAASEHTKGTHIILHCESSRIPFFREHFIKNPGPKSW